MLKVLLILVFGLACESAGVILLKKGMMHIGDMNGYLPTHLSKRSHPQGPDPVWNDGASKSVVTASAAAS